MTNKTELLPCPFCGVKCKGYPVADTLSVEGDHKTWCPFHHADPIVNAVDWNTRAAPAEDVREVVDEPVVYQVKIHGMTLYWNTPSEASKAINTPLYRHPQRKVVMPERRDYDVGMRTSFGEGWNACLDEFARLNK